MIRFLRHLNHLPPLTVGCWILTLHCPVSNSTGQHWVSPWLCPACVWRGGRGSALQPAQCLIIVNRGNINQLPRDTRPHGGVFETARVIAAQTGAGPRHLRTLEGHYRTHWMLPGHIIIIRHAEVMWIMVRVSPGPGSQNQSSVIGGGRMFQLLFMCVDGGHRADTWLTED